jgi:hypothetical protein
VYTIVTQLNKPNKRHRKATDYVNTCKTADKGGEVKMGGWVGDGKTL